MLERWGLGGKAGGGEVGCLCGGRSFGKSQCKEVKYVTVKTMGRECHSGDKRCMFFQDEYR